MKILVIGSRGFIGAASYAYFSTNPRYQCWGSDVMVDYVDSNYFLIDSTSANFNEVFERVAFDICINCSGAASVPDSLQHPLRDFTLNTFNVIKLLEAIRKYNPWCRFINMSSAAVYGNPVHLPVSTSQSCKPISPYGIHKRMSEEICIEYYQHFQVPTCSLRLFSAFGPGLKKQLFWDVYKKTRQSDSLTLFGSGKETRDFIFIDDIIQAVEIIIEKGNFNGGVYNVASGTETAIHEAVHLFADALGYKGEILFSGSERNGDPVNWCADISEIMVLGFKPSISMKEGLKMYVQWLDKERLL